MTQLMFLPIGGIFRHTEQNLRERGWSDRYYTVVEDPSPGTSINNIHVVTFITAGCQYYMKLPGDTMVIPLSSIHQEK